MGSFPERFVFRHGWSVSYGVVPGKQRFQARLGEIPWGRAQKGSFSGHLDIWGDGKATVKREDGPLAEPPGALDL